MLEAYSRRRKNHLILLPIIYPMSDPALLQKHLKVSLPSSTRLPLLLTEPIWESDRAGTPLCNITSLWFLLLKTERRERGNVEEAGNFFCPSRLRSYI
jgi:hypothetical protein